MKKLLSIMAALMTISVIVMAQAERMYVICSDSGRVNIRSSASVSSGIAGYLYAGDSVDVIGKTGKWCKIDTFGMTEASSGWVHSQYLVPDPPEDHHSEVTVVANGRVAVRDGINGKRIAWIQPGDHVTVIRWTGTWALTNRGYIKAEYLR